jgi:two-component system invasion response regulator UvrY
MAAKAIALRIARGKQGQTTLDALSMRELQVLRRLAMGNTNREIASMYGISIKTVDTYRSRLLKKLDLRNNAELSRFAIQNRLIDL